MSEGSAGHERSVSSPEAVSLDGSETSNTSGHLPSNTSSHMAENRDRGMSPPISPPSINGTAVMVGQ